MAIDTPLKRWLADHLPGQQPEWMRDETWALLRRLAAGEDMRHIGLDEGLGTSAINSRLRQAASRLGYPGATTRTWLAETGELADHVVERDPATGCWLWTGKLRPREIGPTAQLPVHARPAHPTTRHPPQRPVRQVLFERDQGPVATGMIVASTCGDRRCVNPSHAAVRVAHAGIGEAARQSVRDGVGTETAAEAARRVGVSVAYAIQLRRGTTDRTPGRRSALQRWLRDHLPAERPANVLDVDWRFARQVAGDTTFQQVADAEGVSRQMVHFRVRRLARTLGYDPRSSP